MISLDSLVDAPNELKFHDFVSFNIFHVPLKPFFKKILEILKNQKKIFLIVPTSKGPPFEKKISKLNFSIFLVTNHTFSTWIWISYVLSFLLRYITWVLVKFFNFSLFYYKISISNQVLPRPLTAKIPIKKDCFWYVWTGKDQNFALRTIFGHFNANWQS